MWIYFEAFIKRFQRILSCSLLTEPHFSFPYHANEPSPINEAKTRKFLIYLFMDMYLSLYSQVY